MFAQVFPQLDAALYKFLHRWNAKATERSGVNFVMFIVGGSVYPRSFNV
jgi:hypothetical protein